MKLHYSRLINFNLNNSILYLHIDNPTKAVVSNNRTRAIIAILYLGLDISRSYLKKDNIDVMPSNILIINDGYKGV